MARKIRNTVQFSVEQRKCDSFNKLYPPGTPMLLRGYSGRIYEVTIIQSAAVVLMHACGYASGFGCYTLDRFNPINNG